MKIKVADDGGHANGVGHGHGGGQCDGEDNGDVVVLGTVWSFFCLMATIAQVLVTMVSMHTGREKRRNDGSNI